MEHALLGRRLRGGRVLTALRFSAGSDDILRFSADPDSGAARAGVDPAALPAVHYRGWIVQSQSSPPFGVHAHHHGHWTFSIGFPPDAGPAGADIGMAVCSARHDPAHPGSVELIVVTGEPVTVEGLLGPVAGLACRQTCRECGRYDNDPSGQPGSWAQPDLCSDCAPNSGF